MAEIRQFRQDAQIIHGTTAQNNAKLTDIIPLQHEDLATQTNQMKKISLGQCLCEPFAVCNSNNPANGAYVADCVNFPDFTLQFTDGQGNNHSLIGLKVRVLFNYGITYGSVSGGTYPTLNINGSGAIPLLAQGKTMGAGAISAGQTVEFTIIPYGNSLAFDADSNVREANSDYTVYTDGTIDNRSKNIFWFMKPLPAYYPSNVHVIPSGDAFIHYFSRIDNNTYHVYFIYDASNHSISNMRGDTSEQIGVSVTSDNKIIISQAFSYSESNYKALDINSDNTVNIAL